MIKLVTEVKFVNDIPDNFTGQVYYPNGEISFFVDGKLHRDHGPANILPGGTKRWYTNGQLNRLDGPAVEYTNGAKEFWVEGRSFSETNFNMFIAMKNDSCNNKIVEIDGKKYKLTLVE